MPVCSICKTWWSYQTFIEPQSPCNCGECASGTLWQWNRYRAYYKWFRWQIYCAKYSRFSPICFYLNYKSVRDDIDYMTGLSINNTRWYAFKESCKVLFGLIT